MTDRQKKVALLSIVVLPLVGLAVYVTSGYFGAGNEVHMSPAWKSLTPEDREKKFDDEERRRRASGRGAMRKLPEDSTTPPAKSR